MVRFKIKIRFTPGGIRKGASGFDVFFVHPKVLSKNENMILNILQLQVKILVQN